MKRELNLIVKRLVLLSESSPSSDLRYNCAGFIGQLTLYGHYLNNTHIQY